MVSRLAQLLQLHFQLQHLNRILDTAINMDNKRKGRLHWCFNQTIEGKEDVLSSNHAKRFLEAVCSENDPVACLSRIISSKQGLPALQKALRTDVSPNFFNSSTYEFLVLLQNPQVAVTCNGEILLTIIRHLVKDTIFWTEFVKHAESRKLNTGALNTFAWFLLRLLSSSDEHLTDLGKSVFDSLTLRSVLQNATDPETRNIYHNIAHICSTLANPNLKSDGLKGPGGRHDNDYNDFRRIAILPTVDELTSQEPPFLRLASELDGTEEDSRLATHLDNQFRLLREDMVRDVREELQGRNKRRSQRIDGLRLVAIECNGKERWALVFDCTNGLHFMPKKDAQKRLDFLRKHKKVFPHGSIVCIIADGNFVGLGLLWRDEDRLAQAMSQLCIHLPGSETSIRRTLASLKSCGQSHIVQLNTALFAYEPVLKQLQNTRLIPLAGQMLSWQSGPPIMSITPSTGLQRVINTIQRDLSCELRGLLDLPNSTRLDQNQAQSLLAGLTQQLALVQGPPGTGKSFLGALVAKAVYKLTECKILVLSYTNHALDQYLEDLMKVGIPDASIVRLGSPSKASNATKCLVQSAQTSPKYKMSRLDWDLVDTYRAAAREAGTQLDDAFQDYVRPSVTRREILDYLEFSKYDTFYYAFELPDQSGEFRFIGRGGKEIDEFYLLDRWLRGKDAGMFQGFVSDFAEIWRMGSDERDALRKTWLAEILDKHIAQIIENGTKYNEALSKVDHCLGERNRRLLAGKRVIGCTTTAAAKYVEDIQSASPDVVIVEEAGEILESHILTALGHETRQLILIGDHKQLRPKAHFDLSVEKGTGYDLNRSLFERLVLKGYPHGTLSEQHRMRPEISALVRELTYPELTDAARVKNRPNIRGLQDNVVFIDHKYQEDETKDAYDPREGGVTLSKTNSHEATMTLRCVRYLAQQGYGSDQIVVLTPYLGQLRLLFDVLEVDSDPVLNDLDSYDLVRAGLMSPATANLTKNRLRISTIDNYQGEESDIIIASLTRSNPRHDIGFLASPERLNVLLSRARNGLILIGNALMFIEARKGREAWSKIMNILKADSHIYDGLPVRCERHPDRQAVLSKPTDFDVVCPDGGCDANCGTDLSCKVHKCPLKCHQLVDHSKMKCDQIITDTCDVGHQIAWKCSDKRPQNCKLCETKRKRDEKKRAEEYKRYMDEMVAQTMHDERMAAIEREIEAIRQQMKFAQADEARRRAYEQKLEDLKNARSNAASTQTKSATATNTAAVKTSTKDSPKAASTSLDDRGTRPVNDTEPSSAPLTDKEETTSKAAKEWERMKQVEGSSNSALDELMQMTGLESVKTSFVQMLQKVQTSQRQGIDIQQERLGTVFLGNPGTGKTTVARLYAKFLVEIGALPGSKFVETTGAKLSNEGVAGTKKMLESIVAAGGGTCFIDEAYQLVSGNSFGGGAVLDYLLAEIENTTGKIVFMFAGYEKQMEKFFQHNPGLNSRMPRKFVFEDYSEMELLHMLQQKIKRKFKGRMAMEDGPDGLYMRIVVRRLHRGSGKEGFGNARELENVLAKITENQSSRLTESRSKGSKPNDFYLTKEDLIGPEPSGALAKSRAWAKLQKMIGLDAVKQAVQTLLDRLQDNYKRELKEQPPVEVSLNKLFLGSPGTGKTTVAKLYGEILAEIGILSTSECVVKTPADFIGDAMGASERNTKAILESTKGKVLVIDEAYMLGSNLGNGPTSTADPYRTAVVDTIVSEVHSAPGEDRAVLLLGYQDQMEDMLRKVNPGLTRRFPVESAFFFEDYNDDQLLSILEMKLAAQGLLASDEAKKTAINVLSRMRRRQNFGNAGEVENLLSRAKDAFSKRQQKLPVRQRSEDIDFEPQDFDADFDRGGNAIERCRALFRDVVGSDEVVAKLEGYIHSFERAISIGMKPENIIPFNFVFKGPPGT